MVRATARGRRLYANNVQSRRTLVSDTFTRANSTTTLGNAETGQAWSALAATWGISSDQAYTTTSVSNALAVVDAGVADVRVRVTTATTGTDNGVAARASSATNYLRFIFESGTWYLQKCVAGAFTTIASAAGANNAGDLVELVCHGASLVGRVNGAVVCSATDSFNSTATKHGMMTSTLSARLDNFLVTAP